MSIDSKQKRPLGLFFDHLYKAVDLVARIALVSLVLLILSEVFLRAIFQSSLGFAEEVSAYIVVVLTVFGGALSFRKGNLFRVHLVIDVISPDAGRRLERLIYVAALVVCLTLAWKMAGFTLSSYERGKIATTVLMTPLWIPQITLPIGFAVLAMFVIEKLFHSLRKDQEPLD